MGTRAWRTWILGAGALLTLCAGQTRAGMVTRGGGATEPSSAPAEAKAPPKQELAPADPLRLCGTIVYAKAGKIVAEVKGGAAPKDRFRLYREGGRYGGDVVAVRMLDKTTFLVEPVGKLEVEAGDRIGRTRP